MSDIVAQGNYTFKGYGQPELGESPEKHTAFVHVAVQIVSEGEFHGRIVNRQYYFSEKATPHTVKALRLLGCTFPNNDITDFTGFGSTTAPGTVVHESYEKDGETKTVAKIGFINEPFGVNPEARMDDAKKAAFKAKMMGTLAASAPKTNGTTAQTSKAPF